ncbi:Thiamin-phosphate pyrophosphorylase [hydrothermal vent metagenome]|uniref:thiamine phosphate synthase n=1 Tax=hydrothermal vent metagenome TaxID=652676 RepID=A0A3B0QUP9_9ZZZZ
MKSNPLPGLYLITDGLQRGGDKEEGELLTKIEAALKGGARLIQLREKGLKGGELLRLAKKLRALTKDYGASLLINDRVDIALSCGADGVHLTASSFSPAEARRLLGKEKLIGVSTHGPDQAKKAERDGADFITLGPVFFTPSKTAYGEPLGLVDFKKITSLIALPVYALGGVKKNNIEETLKAGACGVSMISAILAADDIIKTTQEIIKEIR